MCIYNGNATTRIKIWTSCNNDKIFDFIQKRLTDLLNMAETLPSYDRYLETLRTDIWNKYNHLDVDEIQILIKDGFQEREYVLFKLIIDTIKGNENHVELDDKLKRIGEHAYRYRQMRTLWVFHYAFHAYINKLSQKFKDQFMSRELREIHGTSRKLERVFDGVGNWYA